MDIYISARKPYIGLICIYLATYVTGDLWPGSLFPDVDTHSLVHRFRHIISLASLAYTFSGIHAIQYSMLEHDMDVDNPEDQSRAQNTQDNESASHSALTSTHNPSTIANTSNSSERTSGRWSEQESGLLLDYVEANCSLNTPRGLNLKKSDFNKARNIVMSKDPSQCHYKWGHVRAYH
jgi:hypothetical protein